MFENQSSPQILVLIGGGHTHSLFLRRLLSQKRERFQLIVISESPFTAYSGLLPAQIAGCRSSDEILIRVRELALANHAEFIEDVIASIDFDSKAVLMQSGRHVRYDVLSINCGARPDLNAIPGAALYSAPLKPTLPFMLKYDDFLGLAKRTGRANIVQIGGGIGGVECAAAFSRKASDLGIDCKITLIDSGPELLTTHRPAVRRSVLRMLKQHGIEVWTNERVKELRATELITESGRTLRFDFAALATPAKTEAWVKKLSLELFEGFILIDAALQTSRAQVFAVGDVAQNPAHPLPRSGVYAVRQADVLFDNLLASLAGRQLRKYHPQKNYLTLISDGHGKAIASRGWFFYPRSRLMQKLKDYIDLKFLKNFSH